MTKIKRPRGSMTWAEYEAWLKETGQYQEMVERHRKQHEEHQASVEAMHLALAPLYDALRAHGCSLSSSAGTLTNQPNIPTAIPILLAHLQRTTYPPDARRLIAYALIVPEVKPHWDMLLRLYRDERDDSVKDGLANAIEGAADDDVIADVIALVQDTSQGSSRLLLLRALEKSKDPRARATLEERRTDPDLHEEIKIILKRLDRKAERKMARMRERKQKMH